MSSHLSISLATAADEGDRSDTTALAALLDDRAALVDALRRVIVESLELRRDADEIDPDAPLFGTGLRLDSIDAVELWVGIGCAFGVEPPDELSARILAARTVNTLADTVVASLRGATC